MNLNLTYTITEPFQLPWLFVSPTESDGLEYHLSPDLSLKIDGIVNGDEHFRISHTLMAIDGLEVNELVAEQLYKNEILPAKSQERIKRTFKDEQISCFFTTKQMENLQLLFEEKNFMSFDVQVYYKGRRVDDVTELPGREFQIASDAFDQLHVGANFDYRKSRREIETEYEKAIYAKAAKAEEREQKSVWDKVKAKGTKQKILKSFGSAAIGIGCWIARKRLASKGPWGILAAIIIGTAGIAFDLNGRHEVGNTLKFLKYDRMEKGGFN